MFKKVISIAILLLWAFGSVWAQIEVPLSPGWGDQPFWALERYHLNYDSFPIRKLNNSKCFGCKAYYARIRGMNYKDSTSIFKDTLFVLVKDDARRSKTYVTLNWNFNKTFDDDTTYVMGKDNSYIITHSTSVEVNGKKLAVTKYYKLSRATNSKGLFIYLRDESFYAGNAVIGKDTLLFQFSYFQFVSLGNKYSENYKIGFGKTKATNLGLDEFFVDGQEILIGGMAYRVNIDFEPMKLKLTKLNKSEADGSYAGYAFPKGDFVFSDNGKSSSKELLGKYTLLHAWGWWCGPCHVDFPKLKKLSDKYQDKLNMMGLHMSTTDDLARFEEDISKYQLNWKHINEFLTKSNAGGLDWIDRLNIGSYPTYIIIGPDGLIKLRLSSYENFHKVEEFLANALKE